MWLLMIWFCRAASQSSYILGRRDWFSCQTWDRAHMPICRRWSPSSCERSSKFILPRVGRNQSSIPWILESLRRAKEEPGSEEKCPIHLKRDLSLLWCFYRIFHCIWKQIETALLSDIAICHLSSSHSQPLLLKSQWIFLWGRHGFYLNSTTLL